MQLVPRDIPSGSLVSVVTQLGEKFEGVVYAVDHKVESIAIELGSDATKDYAIIPFSSITSFLVRQRISRAFNAPTIDALAIQRTEERSVLERKAEAEKIGPGVSVDGQAIFDALIKSLPCEWTAESITVMSTTVIRPPYTANDVAGGSEQQLTRVRKMLEEIRRKMKLA